MASGLADKSPCPLGRVAKLADAPDLGSGGVTLGGSSPLPPMISSMWSNPLSRMGKSFILFEALINGCNGRGDFKVFADGKLTMKPAQIFWNKRVIVWGALAFIFSTGTIVFANDGINGITGTVLLGPICPVIRSGMEEQCKDKSLQTQLAVLEKDTARELVRFDSDAKGIFQVIVPPGNYIITSLVGKPYPVCREEVKVSAGQFADVVVHCDTGMR